MFDRLRRLFGRASETTFADRPADPLTAIEQRLISLVPLQIKSLAIEEPMYCLRIWYMGSDTGLEYPPYSLTLKPESLRKKIVAEKKDQIPYYLWCADEFESGDGVVCANVLDPSVRQLHQIWSRSVYSGSGLPDDRPVQVLQRMIQRVAEKLNKLDWQSICSVTDDFVVIPADGSHSIMNDYAEMTASVPHEKLSLLQKRKYFVFE